MVDTDAVYDDHLAALDASASAATTACWTSRCITDGLPAEREQGITIDVAYRYFTTPSRKFIIADTPGHIQYTRNMATGASTADLAIILIDARLGVLQQSRRHAFIASMLGIPYLVVAVNKMDLVDFDPKVYEAIRAEFQAFTSKLRFAEVRFLPISALMGDNVVHRSQHTPWYSGGSMLEILETVDLRATRNLDVFRFPVQYVIRPHLDYRGFAAQIVSGVVKKGDRVTVLPAGTPSQSVKAIDTYDGELDEAFAPQSVVLRLTDEVDVSRGDVLAHPANAPQVAHSFDAMVVWMSETPLDTGKSYLLKHGARYITGWLEEVRYEVDLDTLAERTDARALALNGIGRVAVRASRAAGLRPLRRQPRDGGVHRHRLDDQQHRRRRHDLPAGRARDRGGRGARRASTKPKSAVSPASARGASATRARCCGARAGDLGRRPIWPTRWSGACSTGAAPCTCSDGASEDGPRAGRGMPGTSRRRGFLAIVAAPADAGARASVRAALADVAVHKTAIGGGGDGAVEDPAGFTCQEQAAGAVIAALEAKGLRL